MHRRWSRMAAVALIGMATTLVAAQGSAGVAQAVAPTGPPPIPPVLSVTDLGNVQQNPVINGRDGIMSGEFRGTSYWTFGDTSMSVPGAGGDNWSDNTLSWTTDLDASDGITLSNDLLDSTGAPTEYLPWTKQEQQYNYTHDSSHCTASPCGAELALWSGPVIPDEPRNRILLPYIEIWRIVGQSGWKTMGGGIAVWNNPGQAGSKVVRPIENPGTSMPTLMWGPSDVEFNNGWVGLGPILYTYGCHPGFLVQYCQVARVPYAYATDKTHWTYYAGSGVWSTNPADAVTVFDGGAAGTTIEYNHYLGEYMAIFNDVFSDNVMYRVSYTPWGPWSGEAFLFTGRAGYNGNTDYAGEAHPEYAQGNGQTQYVTYMHPTGFLKNDIPLVQVVFGQPDA